VAVQFAATGTEVVIGSRSEERAAATVDELRRRWSGRELPLVPGDNAAAAAADVVVVATPWEGALTTVTDNAEALDGKLLIPLLPPSGSVAQALAAAVPGARVAGAFHHMPAGPWSDLDHPIHADVMVCADHRATARQVIEMVGSLPGLRGVDAGGLGSALAIESLTAALIEVNRRYKTHASLRINGIDSPE
jgi:NADPH-dependent F420 reductase